MNDRGYHAPTVGYFALVDGVTISEGMAKRALGIVAQMRADDEVRRRRAEQEAVAKRCAEEEAAARKQVEARRLAELPAQKHLHLRTYNGVLPDGAYLLLDPAKVRSALAYIDRRAATDTSPFVLTLHKNGDMHFDHAESRWSTDRPARMEAL